MSRKILYTLAEAADAVGYSPETLRRATHATDPQAFPPPLRAKRGGKGRLMFRAADLEAWADSLPDA